MKPLTWPLLLVLFAGSCTERVVTDPVDAPLSDPVMAQINSTPSLECDLLGSMKQAVTDYFGVQDQDAAAAIMFELATACGAGDAAATSARAIELLRTMEIVADAGRGEDAVVGSFLANALLACTSGAGCKQAALPGLDLVAPLASSAGMFRVPTDEVGESLMARGAMPVSIDNHGTSQSYAAIFGLGLDDATNWTHANNGIPVVLLYGKPVTPGQGGLVLNEVSVGDVQYDVDRWPDAGRFAQDGLVHVGICFVEAGNVEVGAVVALPHDPVTNAVTVARMQREGTLLQRTTPDFCPPVPTQATLFGAVAGVTKSVLASAGLMAFSDVRTPSIGGAAIDFSRFAPVAADPNGDLEMVSGPRAVETAGQPIGPIRIRAVSGAGTPVEAVNVELHVYNNRGEPAGAVVQNGQGATIEDDGTVLIAGAYITKPGGYIICASAPAGADFVFAEVCSERFNIRK